jgi:hypothetical protein
MGILQVIIMYQLEYMQDIIITTGSQNVAIGNEALRFNVARGNNVAVGYYAMYYASNTTSGTLSYNTALGANALRGSTTLQITQGI